VFAAPTSLPTATLATEVRIVDLDAAGQPPAGLRQPHGFKSPIATAVSLP
jgi:hypothetical protein